MLSNASWPLDRNPNDPSYSGILDPAERCLATIRLHTEGEGWTVTCIAGYLQTTR